MNLLLSFVNFSKMMISLKESKKWPVQVVVVVVVKSMVLYYLPGNSFFFFF